MLSILFPDQDRVTYTPLQEESWHDLGLDVLAERVAQKPQEVQLLKRVMTSLTADKRVSAYRAAVFEDLYRYPELRERMAALLDRVKMFYDYGVVNRHEGDEEGIWDLMHRLEEYHEYILTVEELLDCLKGKELASEGLLQLLHRVESIYQEQGFQALKQDVEAMRVTAGEVRSVTLGVNVNDRFEAVSMGLVSVNRKPFTRSSLLRNFAAAVSPRDDLQAEADWNGSSAFFPAEAQGGMLETAEGMVKTGMMLRNPLMGFTLASIPAADGSSRITRQMDHGASLLLSRMTRRLRDVLGKYMNVSVKDISDLIPELVFYTRWAEYISQLEAKGWAFCRAEVFEEEASSTRMEAEGFYNLKLLSTGSPETVVPNDLRFDAEKRVYVLTGANRGGKTTVTQAVGQLFLLAQSGIRVPAKRFCFDPADQVLTHFPADEDRTMDLGRLGEECSRFRELYEKSTENSLLLLNETFSTTSFEEGYYIAVDAIRAVLYRNARMIYNTHMHKLAQDLDAVVNSAERPGKAISLVAETREGHSTFRVRLAPPEGKSFAREIAEKYGVTYEGLTGSAY